MIKKVVESTKRDEHIYVDHKGIRRQEQEKAEKSKQQWLKQQRERKMFISHMNKSAEIRDKNKG